MERKLPEIEIEGTKFLFDIDKIALIEKGNPHNEIYFDGMRDNGTHYLLDYSATSKNYHFIKTPETIDKLLEGILDPAKIDPLIHAKIPRIGVIDPEGMSRKYGCTLQDIEQKSDFEIIINQEAFSKRMTGTPVTIELAGKKFEIDVANNLLKPQDGNGENIYLNRLHSDYYVEDNEAYHLFYNIREGKVEDPLQDGTRSKTEDRVILEVPNLSILDPIGANLALGANPRYGLLYSELKMHHVPKVVPWEKYGITMANAIEKPDQKENNIIERALPTTTIEGTEFIVDVGKFELREKGNEVNVIPFEDMRNVGNGYVFEYDLLKRNLPSMWSNNETTTVKIPEFALLDPVGMAQKYNLTLDEIKGKSDFEIMIDQKAFNMRVNRGMLPTIEIAGHTFYVDLQMNKLRPKDDFLSNGIVFSDIEKYYDEDKRTYTIPYNPKTHEFQEPDYRNIKELPNNLIAVEFPSERLLDRIGWNRKYGFDLTHGLDKSGLTLKFTAKEVPWEKTFLVGLIKSNLRAEKREKEKKENPIVKPQEKKQRKGRKM